VREKTVTIRRAQKEDTASVGLLWLRLLEEHVALESRFDVADDALERWTNDFAHWVDDEHYRVFVAERRDDLVGFATAGLWRPLPIYAETEEVALNELYVVPEARKEGIGGRLVEAVRAWAEAIAADRLRIGVLAANAGGRAFWARMQAQPLSLTLTIEVEKPVEVVKEIKKKRRLGF
jgi:GNAT superfamily N-acetyltransferase